MQNGFHYWGHSGKGWKAASVLDVMKDLSIFFILLKAEEKNTMK